MSLKNKLENSLSKKFKAIEGALNTKMKTALGLIVLLSLAFSAHTLMPHNDMVAGSVMITNIAGNSGGTGVILDSSPTKSRVLTNAHVCGVVEKGGLVSGQAGSFLVSTYKKSESHDICMITVDGDLKYNTKVASRPPTPYYENATISGHPALLPVVKTTGHFSGRMKIEVMIGLKKCTDDDLKDPGKMIFCLLAGGIPQVKRYDSTLVTATIMPGSSGSGVYNENNELTGLAFAGSSGFGYAFTVPYEYLANFINVEEKNLIEQRPDAFVDLFSDNGDSSKNKKNNTPTIKKLKEVCSTPEGKKIKDLCDILSRDLVYYK